MKRYKVPTSLDTGRLDATINLKTSDGTSLKHFNLGLLLYVILVIFACAKVSNLAMVSQLTRPLKILLFVCTASPLILWRVLTDGSGRPLYLYIPYLMDLFKYSNPLKQSNGSTALFETFFPYASVVNDNVIQMTNGRVAALLNVTGRVSNSMTQADVEECIDAFDMFFRNMKHISDDVCCETFTTIESVNTIKQVAYTEELSVPEACLPLLNHRLKMLKRKQSGILFGQYMFISATNISDLSDVIGAIPANALVYEIMPAKDIPKIMSRVALSVS